MGKLKGPLHNCHPAKLGMPSGLHLPFKYFAEDHGAALSNLGAIHKIDFENAFFGHGKPILKTAKNEIINFIDRHAGSLNSICLQPGTF